MKLNSANVSAHAWAAIKDTRPIQLKIGGHRYSMERGEAVALARELVAAVDAIAPEPPVVV